MKYAALILLLSATAAMAAPLVPTPVEMKLAAGAVALSPSCRVIGDSENPRAAAALQAALTVTIQGLPENAKIPKNAAVIALGRREGKRLFPDESRALAALKPQEYLLRVEDGKILLAGGDEAGTFYAVKTLAQLLENGPLPHVRIADSPSFAHRGIVEGFYGKPWSHENRLSIIRFMGATKLNTYIYAPKDDPYHREKWRESYPAKEKEQLGELARVAAGNFVDFVFAISPGLSVTYSGEEDFKALCGKIEDVRTLGIRHFSLLLDDISDTLNNADDRKQFADFGKAQAFLINRLYEYLISRDAQSTLVICPTHYSIVKPDGYLKSLGAATDSRIDIMWTGDGVCSTYLKPQDADTYGSGILRKPYVWDNYPVNDYESIRVFMGPVRNRPADLSEHLAGLVSNPMNQAEASKVPLCTYADYLWNSSSYDPERSWQAALERVAGRKGYPYLKLFAEQNQSSFLWSTECRELSRLIVAYQADSSQNPRALRALMSRFANLHDDMMRTVENKALIAELEPFLDKLARYGETGLACLEATKDLDVATAWENSFRIRKLRAWANELGSKVCGGVMEMLISRPELSGTLVRLRRAGAASFPTYQENVIENMLDHDLKTFAWSNRSAASGDWVMVDLGREKPVDRIRLLMGDVSRTEDWIHAGELQYTTDMKDWKPLMAVDKAEVSWEGSAIPMRAVRVVVKAAQQAWVIVREFEVRSGAEPTASTTILPAAGSEPEQACDGSLNSAFRSLGRIREGDWLRVDLGEEKAIRKITLLMDPDAYFKDAVVERSVDGVNWERVGDCSECAFQAKLDSAKARYVRVMAKKDQPGAVAVHELVAE